jgi:hypothetical protein
MPRKPKKENKENHPAECPGLEYAGAFRHGLNLGNLRYEIMGLYATPPLERHNCPLILTLLQGERREVYSLQLECPRDCERVAVDAAAKLDLDPEQIAADLQTLFDLVFETLEIWEAS